VIVLTFSEVDEKYFYGGDDLGAVYSPESTVSSSGRRFQTAFAFNFTKPVKTKNRFGKCR
jgi:hypothetical protein